MSFRPRHLAPAGTLEPTVHRWRQTDFGPMSTQTPPSGHALSCRHGFVQSPPSGPAPPSVPGVVSMHVRGPHSASDVHGFPSSCSPGTGGAPPAPPPAPVVATTLREAVVLEALLLESAVLVATSLELFEELDFEACPPAPVSSGLPQAAKRQAAKVI
jgi:hypothetical protein